MDTSGLSTTSARGSGGWARRRQRNGESPCARELSGRDIQVEDRTSLVRLCDEELQLHRRCIELRIQSALESQRGKSVRFLSLASVVALRIVGRASAGKLCPRLRTLYLNLFTFL